MIDILFCLSSDLHFFIEKTIRSMHSRTTRRIKTPPIMKSFLKKGKNEHRCVHDFFGYVYCANNEDTAFALAVAVIYRDSEIALAHNYCIIHLMQQLYLNL